MGNNEPFWAVLKAQRDLTAGQSRQIFSQSDRVIGTHSLSSAIGRLDMRTLGDAGPHEIGSPVKTQGCKPEAIAPWGMAQAARCSLSVIERGFYLGAKVLRQRLTHPQRRGGKSATNFSCPIAYPTAQ